METIRCPECGKDTSAPDGICEHCGFPLKKSEHKITHRWRCVNCGAMVYSTVCSHCGKPSTVRETIVPSENTRQPVSNGFQNSPVKKPAKRPLKIVFAFLCSISLVFVIIIALSKMGHNPIEVRKSHANTQDYKTAIAEHMKVTHGLSIDNYESFYTNEDGSASASVKVTVAIEKGLGSMGMSADLQLNEDCRVDSCSLCDLGIGYNGGAPKQEKSSTSYRDYILRKAEELTGFAISVELDNYEEHEVTENGRTYIDIFAFINIEKMAGTSINSTGVFQLYAIINPDNEEDLFIAITGNATGEIYRYDHTSVPH